MRSSSDCDAFRPRSAELRRADARPLAADAPATRFLVALCSRLGCCTSVSSGGDADSAALARRRGLNRLPSSRRSRRLSSLDLRYLEAFEGQRVAARRDETRCELARSRVASIRRSWRMRFTLTSIYIHELTAEVTACRQAFELGASWGQTSSRNRTGALDLVERLRRIGLNVACTTIPRDSPILASPRVLKRSRVGPRSRLCRRRDWQRSGSSQRGVRLLDNALMCFTSRISMSPVRKAMTCPGTGRGYRGAARVHKLG